MVVQDIMEQMAGKGGAGKRKDKISMLKAKRKHEAMLGAAPAPCSNAPATAVQR